MRKKINEADLIEKNDTNVFAEFLSKVMPRGQGKNVALLPPTPQKMRRGTQTTATSASFTATPQPPPIKEYTYEPAKQEIVEDDDDEDDHNEDDNLVEDEAQ